MLTFPTLAEQAATLFREKKAKSLAAAIKALGGEKTEQNFGGATVYTFSDDTSIEVRGRGKGHTFETYLP